MSAFRRLFCVAVILTTALAARTATAFPVDFLLTDADGRLSLGEYWIGISCDAVGDDLRAHIELPKYGVIVREVFPGSAAAKAGLKVHDIVLTAGSTELKDAYSLIKAVQQSKGEKLALEIVRKGKREIVDVTPQKRPAEKQLTAKFRIAEEGLKLSIERKKLLEEMLKGQKGVRVLMLEPGRVVPNGWWQSRVAARAETNLPDGVQVSITRTNDQPARIKVVRGKESWEVTEKELDKLPPDIGPQIKKMLGNAADPTRLRIRVPQVIDRPVGGEAVTRRVFVNRPKGEEDQKTELKKLAEEIRRLAEKIEKLEQRDKQR